jgi:DNA polymerase IV
MRQILHIDMDAFFASVEQRDDPSLRGKPVVVGSPSRRGVVAAASYEVRPFGVHSAMPMYEARKRCPEAIIVPPRHDRYIEVSREIFAVFRAYTPLVEGLSLDEAFLDVTESAALFGSGADIARKLKDGIRARTGLTASAGVAPCKFVAKIASDLEKPDGLVVVPPERVRSLLAALPIERMWGVGPKTAPKVRAAGYATLGDIATADTARLEELLGSWGKEAQLLARGIDPRPVVPDAEAKSYGAEETFERDLTSREEIETTLLAHSARVAERLLRDDLAGRIVTIKMKSFDFKLVTRRRTIESAVSDTDSIFEAARALLASLPALAPIRLTGVSVSGLEPSSRVQPGLFDRGTTDRRRRLEEVSVQIHDRFGDGAVTRAALLERQRK